MDKPIVSVCMVTYGQEKFIKKAIESVLMQECNFEIELIVGNDCSPDKTDEIIQSIKQNHPKSSRINYIKHEKNIGMELNFLSLLNKCRGKYIALLDGDDYWTDVHKLQIQIDFLEANPTYSLCFHDVYNLINGKLKKSSIIDPPDTSDINYLLSHSGYITTVSVVFRNNPQLITLLKKMEGCPFGDFIAYVAAAQLGLIKYIPRRMGIYRIHSTGIWTTLGNRKAFEQTLKAYKMLFAELPKEQADMLKIKYLATLEEYFLQTDNMHTQEEFEKLLIAEMDIKPYVIWYLKQSCAERKKVGYYASKVPYNMLLKSLKYKVFKKISSR